MAISRAFRWHSRTSDGSRPLSVAVAGSLTHWKPVALEPPRRSDDWQVVLRDIPGNRTHRYVLLVDGKPTLDEAGDGLVPPSGLMEVRHQFDTPHGPRVCLLFANTK